MDGKEELIGRRREEEWPTRENGEDEGDEEEQKGRTEEDGKGEGDEEEQKEGSEDGDGKEEGEKEGQIGGTWRRKRKMGVGDGGVRSLSKFSARTALLMGTVFVRLFSLVPSSMIDCCFFLIVKEDEEDEK